MADIQTYIVSGTAYWASVIKSKLNYGKDGQEWSIDVSVDADAKKYLVGLGLKKKIKNKDDERGSFIQFKRATVKKNGPKKGQPNESIKIVGPDGKTPWGNTLIGNGSLVKVKFTLNETKDQRTGEKGFRADPLAIQVVKHVQYVAPERQEFDAAQDVPEEPTEGEAPGKDW